MANRLSHVAVLFGGPSPEHDVSVLTGLLAVQTLRRVSPGIDLHAIYWSKSDSASFFEVSTSLEATDFLDGPPKDARPLELVVAREGGFLAKAGRLGARAKNLEVDAVLLCCHGGPGEDGSLQATLDLVGIPYTGPSAAGAALGMDKLATGAVLAAGGVPILPRIALSESRIEPPTFGPPYIVKPRFGGSSIGIEVVSDHETALALARSSVHLRRGAVLEPYGSDLFDLQIAVRTWPKLELSAIERPLRVGNASEILNYADKYVGGEGMHAAPRELPAQITPELAEQLREFAITAAELLGARGVNRIDFLSDGELLYANEINTIPGSLARHLFIDPPVGFEQLLLDLLSEAVERPSRQYSSAGADGAVLRDAKSIAAKLA